MEKNCGNCKFWDQDSIYADAGTGTAATMDLDIGECVRNPPQIVGSITEELDCCVSSALRVSNVTRFPVMSYVRVCGEWKKG